LTSLLRRVTFNLWYFRHPPWDTGISPPELMEFITSHPPGRALDLGCGTGTNVITLARNGWQATGVDFASQAISLARRKVQAAGVHADLRVADVTRLDGITGPFDFILDLGCFHSLRDKDKDRYLEQVNRLSVRGGFWLLYGFFKDSAGRAGPGLVSGDVERMLARFQLVSRRDGFNRGDRPSAYFLFSKI